MKISKSFLVIGVVAFVLASCGKTDTKVPSEPTTSSPTSPVTSSSVSGTSLNPSATNGVATPDTLKAINANAEERQRIAKLDKLTEENLKTQTAIRDGKTILNDRTLFANYLKSKGVDTSKKLLEGISELKEFAKKSGIELTDADIRTVMYATDAENKGWDMCGEFKANKDKMDGKNEYFATLEALCPSLDTVTKTPEPVPQK
jgi:hypothetical protein